MTIHLLQRLPTYVIEVGETTIGLERDVARGIVLRPPADGAVPALAARAGSDSL